MKQFLLLLPFLTPLFLIAQNTQSEHLMNQLGYEKVELENLNKKQITQKPCSTCPLNQTNNNKKTTNINPQQELTKLYNLIPQIKHQIDLLTKDQNADPTTLQKYNTALKNTLYSIEKLERYPVNN